ncbi:MAG: hypothetical protein NZV14_06045 [Bryobacteraceae bacterium]|nr:hypothetical protein [Bryobacteraceae bacterium]MDW8377702.1 hypothetical protein [Bryobacterales bacterium]
MRQKVRQRGHVLLETALVFTALSLLFVAVFDVSQFLFVRGAWADRAQAAARWVATQPSIRSTDVCNFIRFGTPVPEAGSPLLFAIAPDLIQVRVHDVGSEEARVEVRILPPSPGLISSWLASGLTERPVVAVAPLGIHYEDRSGR